MSALVPPSVEFSASGLCPVFDLLRNDKFGPPPTLVNGNLRAAVGNDGRLTFTRVSDETVLLQEQVFVENVRTFFLQAHSLLCLQIVRKIEPTVLSPPIPGFYSLDLAFNAVEGERIYGLGQHAKLPWDGNFPTDVSCQFPLCCRSCNA